MNIAEAKEMMKGKHQGVLVARRKDGSLQMTLVSPAMTASGDLIITSRETTYKVKNIKRNPQISLVVYGERFNGSQYIQVDGKAEIIPQPQAMDTVLEWHRQVRGEADNWDDLRKKYLAERRIVMRIQIDRVGPQNRG
ncbi:MAG: TIGR03618 family F420-dependent PPOX class oxidoreductase [Deltaproteobacteria bacterium]|nr:TIGR03618 family F420-dependent PPOX class oxidoreductase [Deltaproteobacteria bacterium]